MLSPIFNRKQGSLEVPGVTAGEKDGDLMVGELNGDIRSLAGHFRALAMCPHARMICYRKAMLHILVCFTSLSQRFCLISSVLSKVCLKESVLSSHSGLPNPYLLHLWGGQFAQGTTLRLQALCCR